MLREYASHGFRVLAIASKSITEENMKEWRREQVEENLVFNGFEVFENPLKKETTAAIEELKAAKIDCVMITGDNTLTGSNISFKCNISDRSKHMIIIDFLDGKMVEENFIFHDYDNTKAFPTDKPIAESYIEDDIRVSLLSKGRSSRGTRSYLKEQSHMEGFEPMKDNNDEFMFNATQKAEESNSQLCVTGRAFNELFSGSVTELSKVQR